MKKLRKSIILDNCELGKTAKLSEMDSKTSEDNDNNKTDSVTSHQFTNNNEDTAYICEMCKDTFQSIRALSLHSRYHLKSNGLKFTCALCGVTFETNRELVNHKLVHDSEDRCFMCNKCKLAYTSHHDYLRHNTRHMKTPLYKCIECSYTFHLLGSYKNHISMHYLKQLKCNSCQEIFTHKYDLARHKLRYHMPGTDCVECGKNCPTRRDYVKHMINHTGVKVFQCLYCGEGFSGQSARSVHTRKMHTNFIPYECTVCSNNFHTAFALKAHMITHETQRKYECNDCGKQLFRKDSMILHTRRHMNYKLFKCPMCERAFPTYDCLYNHTEAVHVKIRRYKCEPCKMSFILKSSLRNHWRSRNHRNNAYADHSINDEK